MRSLIALFLALHALAHLVGFLVPWRLAPSGDRAAAPSLNRLFGGRIALSERSMRGLGVLWLVVGLSFLAIDVAWWRESPWAGEALVVIVLVSLVMTAVWWPATRIGLALNVAIVGGLALSLYLSYRFDIASARSATRTSAVLALTSAGPIEYAVAGKGDPLLAIHGTGGGWDQGLAATSMFAADGFQVIAPSRFGYLGTPMPADASPSAEADAFAALLDHLAIERATVISYSAGATPALQFALRYPQRVEALILVVPAAGGIAAPAAPGPPAWVMNFVLRFDFPMWFAVNHMPRTTAGILAVPYSLVRSASDAEIASYRRVANMLLPVSARREGMILDARNQSGGVPRYRIEEIAVPTLLISAEDDLYGTANVARAAAGSIPEAEVLIFPTGGHLLLGLDRPVQAAVEEFVDMVREQKRVPTWQPVR